MVLGADRQPLVAGDRLGPRVTAQLFSDAVELEAQVVVQPARRVLLDDELSAGSVASGRTPVRAPAYGRNRACAAYSASGCLRRLRRLRIFARGATVVYLSRRDRAICISQYFKARRARAAHGEAVSSSR